MPWANKPSAVLHAEVLQDDTRLDEIFQFFLDNPLPRWQFHPGPPYPNQAGEQSLPWYFERGNPIIVCLDQDDELWGVRILSLDGSRLLWTHFRREEDFLHEPLGDNPYGGLTEHNKEEIAHMRALQWAISGIIDDSVPTNLTENPNVPHLPWDEVNVLIHQKYNTIYGPQYGRV